MQVDLDKIRAHAEDRLAEPTSEGGDRIASFKRLLKLETDRLRMRHRFGLGGREITQGRSYLVDLVVSRACKMVAGDLGHEVQEELAATAVVAVGGYGRRELAPCSDVDLLFLRPGRSTPVLEDFVERLLPLLWDVGLVIGHSFRSVAECVAMGREDLHSRNAMSDARLVTGSEALFARLEAEMDDAVYRNARATEAFLRLMRTEQEERLAHHGDAVCMQEPNVKEGAGGLRDVHTVGWLARSLLGCRDVDRLYETGHVSASEHARVRRAYDFVSRARNEVHLQMNRAYDTLALNLQPGVAEALGYEGRGGLEPSERFMRDYYRSAQELRRFNELFLLRTGAMKPREPLLPFRRRSRPVGSGGRYSVKHGALHPTAGSPDFGGSADGLLEVFELAQQEGVPLSDELKHAVRSNLRLVDRSFRDSTGAADRFLALLGRTGRVGAVVRAMHDTGFLGRYLPPFKRIAMLVQHDRYHRYTVDEHTIRALEAMDRLVLDADGQPASWPPGSARDLLARALNDVGDPALLALAVLLHDVGKGRGEGHAARGARIAKRVAERLGLDTEAIYDVVFLVQKHLVMSRVSQRRDLSDHALVRAFVSTVATPDRLNMLFVLTYADTHAVGPGVWSDWKGSLLASLYLKAYAQMGSDALPLSESDQRVRLEEKVLDGLTPEYLRDDVEAFLQALPDRYLRAVRPDVIARHFRMVRELGSKPLLTHWTSVDHGRHTVLSACVKDAPGVLARLAGTLTGAGFDILSVDAFTRTDGLVLDVFTLAETDGSAAGDEARWAGIDGQLVDAIEGHLDVEAGVARRWARLPRRQRRRAPTPPDIRFDAPDALGRTVVEVRADDRPGLVYRIADCLSRVGLDISFAKIATDKSRALDIFYVTRADGRPIEGEATPHVEAELVQALTREWPPST